jgi:hypothetical protein
VARRRLRPASWVAALGVATVACLGMSVLASPALAVPPELIAGGPGKSTGLPAGTVWFPNGVAVDQAIGDLYVADQIGERIDKFDAAGHFLLAFGEGVVDGSEALETCTTVCDGGIGGHGPGGVLFPKNVAVDNSAGASKGDVYVFESGNARIAKFSSAGAFLWIAGKGVDKGPHHPGDLCTSQYVSEGDACGQGAFASGPGEFSSQIVAIAVGPTGQVWAGDTERLEQFSPQGAFVSEIALPGDEHLSALAIDTDPFSPSFEDFYAISSDAFANFSGGVRKLSSAGLQLETLDAAGHPTALGVDPANGNLFVSDQPSSTPEFGNGSLLEFAPSGEELEAFGQGQLSGFPVGDSLAFGDTGKRLYVTNSWGTLEGSAVQAFTLPAPGPYLREGSLTVVPRPATAAVHVTLVPEGAATDYHFEYETRSEFEAGGAGQPFTHTTTTKVLAADFAAHELVEPIGGLSAETAYRYRLVAENAGDAGHPLVEEASFTTLPPVVIDSESARDVAATSATLQAEINDLGEPAEYDFEYITQRAYEANQAAGQPLFAGASLAPVPDGVLGAVEGDQTVSQHVTSLLGATAYRYRVKAHGAGGAVLGAGGEVTTQGPASPLLPDNREWEMVSPPDKHGAVLLPDAVSGLIQAAANGDALGYQANAATEAEPAGFSETMQILSRRGASSWQSQDIATPHEATVGLGLAGRGEYLFFSEDLSSALAQPVGPFSRAVSPQASEETLYLRSDFPSGDLSHPCASSCYLPLVSGCPGGEEPCSKAVEEVANVPEGTKFGEGNCSGECPPKFLGATPDLKHVVFRSPIALTEGAPSGLSWSLYEWSAGRLALASVLPNGQPVPPSAKPALGWEDEPGTGLDFIAISHHAISDDGSRILFTTKKGSTGKHLYLRDMVREETIQLDTPEAACTSKGGCTAVADPVFQTASANGSRVFFTDSQPLTQDSGEESDLYECQIEESEEGSPSCRLSDLTPLTQSKEQAGVLGLMAGASEDGSVIYFTANGKLTEEPSPHGEEAVTSGNCKSSGGTPEENPEAVAASRRCNLYERSDGQTKLVAVLSGSDFPDWWLMEKAGLGVQTTRVSGDGQWLAFMSRRSLSGYDNRDAVSGKPDQEMFLYHAGADGGAGALVCASCNPSGGRPHGVQYKKINTDEGGISGGESVWPAEAGIAANIPGWTGVSLTEGRALHQSRYLDDSGRLFFNAADALLPQDSNGAEDVYEYEPPGVGNCSEGTSAFSPSSGGCVGLISSGTGKEEAAFLDASESGDDVFFLTSQRLLPGQDLDTSRDVYDAHVCSGASPCLPSAASTVPACEGDACQSPVAPPEDQTPGSLTFQGPGNPALQAVSPPKPKTAAQLRAEKLKRALDGCHRMKKRRKRVACEANARKLYGPHPGKPATSKSSSRRKR